jgi:large-conductance mechanosensitive channel
MAKAYTLFPMDVMEKIHSKAHVEGFIDFIRERAIVGLAMGFVLGGSVSQMVNSFINDIINPIVGVVIGSVGVSSRKLHYIYGFRRSMAA